MLGRYCATIDEQEIQEGLAIVQRQLSERTVRAGNEELIKSAAREKGQVRIIDIIAARLNAKTASHVTELPSLKLREVRISDELVKAHQRMLTGGFYAEVSLGYAASIALEKGGRPLSPNFSMPTAGSGCPTRFITGWCMANRPAVPLSFPSKPLSSTAFPNTSA